MVGLGFKVAVGVSVGVSVGSMVGVLVGGFGVAVAEGVGVDGTGVAVSVGGTGVAVSVGGTAVAAGKSVGIAAGVGDAGETHAANRTIAAARIR